MMANGIAIRMGPPGGRERVENEARANFGKNPIHPDELGAVLAKIIDSDAIVVSERLLKDDAYTSIHIQEFATEVRETKLGREEITRDIPNVPESQLRNLDAEGLIRVDGLRCTKPDARIEEGQVLTLPLPAGIMGSTFWVCSISNHTSAGPSCAWAARMASSTCSGELALKVGMP